MGCRESTSFVFKNTMNRLKPIGLFLSRADIFFYTLIWLMILLVVGTVAQKYVGLYQAQHTYFSSFIVWAGPIPLPGGFITMGVIFINLLAKLVFASPWRWKNSGIIITHIGALLLLFGGFLTSTYSREGDMVIYEGETVNFFSNEHNPKPVYLPFRIKLIDFEKQYHPASGIPRAFKSDIILMDGSSQWPSTISMNEPLRYKGYTFYQSSFIEEAEREATVFAVVKNIGRMFPYISSIIMCLGLLIHMAINIPRLIK